MKRRTSSFSWCVILIGAAGGGGDLWFRREKVPDRYGRSDQDPRPRSRRLGVGQDPTQAARQHQRRHRRAASSTSPSTKAIVSAAASSSCRSIRSRCAPESKAAPLRCRRRRPRSTSCVRPWKPRASSCSRPSRTSTVSATWRQQLNTREALERAENDVKAAESSAQRAREADQRAVRAHQSGAGDARQRPLRPEQGPHRIAHRRHRDATQHSGRRNGRHRHDEQRRHRAADACRHVGHTGRGRSRRNQPAICVAIGQLAKITIDALPDRTFKGRVTEIGNSPIQQTGARARPRRRHARPPTSRWSSSSTKTFPTCDPDSPARPTSRRRRGTSVPAVPIPAVAVRELVYDARRADREAAARSEAEVRDHRTDRPGRRARTGPDPQGDRRRLRPARLASSSTCRSRSASPAIAISRFCRA